MKIQPTDEIQTAIINSLRSKVEEGMRSISCPVHGSSPIIELATTDGKISFKIETCCPEFKKQVGEELKRILK